MIKKVRMTGYNYNFNPHNGFFARWGKTLKDDPEYSPLGPEILDMEISTICDSGCAFCYKSNTEVGENMSFETFKTIFHKVINATIKIELENGKTVELLPEQEIYLKNGETIKAEDVSEGDDVDEEKLSIA